MAERSEAKSAKRSFASNLKNRELFVYNKWPLYPQGLTCILIFYFFSKWIGLNKFQCCPDGTVKPNILDC